MFQTSTSGAENDRKQAILLARRMVLDWGMSEKLDPFAFGETDQQVFLGEELAQLCHYRESTARVIDKRRLMTPSPPLISGFERTGTGAENCGSAQT